jgi:hypothetical protein
MDIIKELKDFTDLVPILVFLLPGFLTMGVIELLVVCRPKDTFDKVVLAFVLTFLNLLLFSVSRWVLEKVGGYICSSWTFDHVNFYTPGNLILILICSVGLGLAWSYEATNENMLEWLRLKSFTTRTHKPSTWRETFVHGKGRWVVVHLKDGRRIFGYPLHYSDGPEERSIHLEPAMWLTEEDGVTKQSPPTTLLLDENIGIEFIEFVEQRTTNE